MKKPKILILLIAIIAINSFGYSSSLPTNKQVIDSIFNSFLSKVQFNLETNKVEQIQILDNKEHSYFNDLLLNSISASKIKINENSPIKIKLSIHELKINYIESKDKLNREIHIIASIFALDKNGETKLLESINSSFKDTITEADINLIENDVFPFTIGKLPKAKNSFFDEIIEPIIVVSASVLTVVLFFSIRTK